MNKKKLPLTNIGTASILTVFVVLCMVAFSLLSYMNARKDADFNQQLKEKTDAYYAASSQAYEKIAMIDQELLKAWQNKTLDSMEPTYSFSVPVDDTHVLEVELTVYHPQDNEGSLYRITRFQEVSTSSWDGDENLNLMQFPE